MKVFETVKDELQSEPRLHDAGSTAQSLNNSWAKLCERFLPCRSKDSIWRHSRPSRPGDPGQGWKLHLSANLLTACEVIQRVAPLLETRGVLFKAPARLQELIRINSGLHYGYSQVGKFITIYPRSDREAVFLARQLHKLTLGLSAPAVPFDLQFRPGSCVYYRYGAFAPVEMDGPGGARIYAIRNPDGEMVPDLRQAEAAKPDWVSDPFLDKRLRREARRVDTPLSTTFKAFRALSQRGKGGVYQALDLSADPPRLCILKEGRRGGEINWDGRDGYRVVKNEEQVLRSLQAAGIKVPRVYSAFEVEGNYYLAMEFMEGESLQALLAKRRKRLTAAQAIRCGINIALIVARIHAEGWVWRDCKPANIFVTREGEFRPLDFEGACRADQPDSLAWVTAEFAPPEWKPGGPVETSEDVYSVGAIIYFLLTGRLFEASRPVSISNIRRNVPAAMCDIISDLMAADPEQRPSARTAAQRLAAALIDVSQALPRVSASIRQAITV